MTNYYIEKDNKIIIVESDKNIILNRQKHQPQYQNLEIKETKRYLKLMMSKSFMPMLRGIRLGVKLCH